MKKRFLSLLLAIVMVLSIFPVTVFAEGEETEPVETVEAEEGIQEEPEPVEETTESGEDETEQGEENSRGWLQVV